VSGEGGPLASGPVAAAIAELPGFEAGREAERFSAAAMLRGRAVEAIDLGKRGRFTRSEAERLARWLNKAADDIADGVGDG